LKFHEKEKVGGELPTGAKMLVVESTAATRRDIVKHLRPHIGDEAQRSASSLMVRSSLATKHARGNTGVVPAAALCTTFCR